MKYKNIVIIDGEKKEITTLPEKERKALVEELNRRALEVIGYERIQTA